ncbi:MAG TPA: hypothetical protein VM779_07870 [Thermoanaerobaculia bacterium]|nr:hypothetical protein [Thermoanaerobaculia bacterium]
MRRISLFAVALFIASHAVAAPQRAAARGHGAVPGASWIQRVATDDLKPETSALSWEAMPVRPVALVETNYYTFLPGERVQLRISTYPNGYSGAVTMYLYRENRSTGERRYYNIAAGDLLPAGESRDLFSISSEPVRVVVPQVSDFVLFGTAADPANSWGVNGALGGSITVPAGQTGLYQYVLEIRDAAGQRALARSNAMYSYIEESVPVSGTIGTNTTWTANKRYVLSDFVGVAPPATLTIEPGTVIYGGNTRATLFIQRGAKIMANGTNRRPIIFTSAQTVGSRGQTDWGSIVLMGGAPVNDTRGGLAGESYLEGLPQTPEYRFGGPNAEESSGVLRYVRLEFGGFEIQPNQEINGLSMAGVGRGTVVEYVQVLQNKDDAFEFWGGTVNARYLLGVGFADDGLDFDLGYTGNIQYAVMIKRAANDENDSNFLTETDGHPETFTLTPKTAPLVYNVTAIREDNAQFGNYGGVLRRGASPKFYNVIMTNARHAPLTIRDTATFDNVNSGELVFDSSILFGDFSDARFPSSSDRAVQTRDFLFGTMKRNRNVDPMLALGSRVSSVTALMPDVSPLPGSPALNLQYVAQPPDDGFLEQVDFIGGVGPGRNWVLEGWANFSDN